MWKRCDASRLAMKLYFAERRKLNVEVRIFRKSGGRRQQRSLERGLYSEGQHRGERGEKWMTY